MKLKKYRASNMAEAMNMIRAELGPDAVIMSSRQVKKKTGLFGLFSKKELEVLAGYDDEEPQFSAQVHAAAAQKTYSAPAPQPAVSQTASTPQQTSAPSAGSTSQSLSNESLSERIDELHMMVEKLLQRMNAVPDPSPDRRFSRDVLELYHRLKRNSIDEGTAEDICTKAEDIVITRDADAEDVVRNIILDTLGAPHLIEPVKYQRKTIMLVGPTGVGKTTTLIKLAYMLVYQKNVNIGIINTDSFRVAAQEHMQSYCDILKTDMLTVYKPEEIGEALDAFRNKDVVLIDTAGKVSDDAEYREDIKKLMEMGQIDEVFITLSASTSEPVLAKIVENYSFLRHYNIIVTKTDEAPPQGVLLYLARISGKPLSYMTTGQTVPDDILTVEPAQVADSILVES